MVHESIAGLVPKVVLRRSLESKAFLLLVTESRSIFIPESPQELFPGKRQLTSRYVTEDPELLATDPKNFVIKHEWLEKIELRKSRIGSGYLLRLDYIRGSDKRRKKIKARLLSLPAEIDQGSIADRPDDLGYARMVRALYQRAIPAKVLQELADWRF